MSEQEIRIGKCKEFQFGEGLSFEDKVKNLAERGYEIPDIEAAVKERYFDNNELFAIDDRIFLVLEDVETDFDDIAHATIDDKGIISYVLKYYNGGTCFTEMIEEAVKNMESKEKAVE